VTPTNSLKRSAWEMAFWPVVASRTRRTSWGAPSADAGTFAPDFELFDRGGAERIACGEKYFFALAVGEIPGEFRYRGGLAHTIYSDYHYYGRRQGGKIQARRLDREDASEFLLEKSDYLVRVSDLPGAVFLANIIHNAQGCADAYVHGDKGFLQFVKACGVELSADSEDGLKAVSDGPAGLSESLLEF